MLRSVRRFMVSRSGPHRRRSLIATLYKEVTGAAREPALYAYLGVPNTIEGRFESLSLHMVLVLRALRGRPAPAEDIAGDLTDVLFRDLDASLREMGVGDTAVPKRMKSLAQAFYGRARVYDAALDAADELALAGALARNVRGGAGPALGLARYTLAADRVLRAGSLDAILRQGLKLPAPEGFVEEGTS